MLTPKTKLYCVMLEYLSFFKIETNMSANNYTNSISNENQGYTFNGVPPFYPQCSSDDPFPSNYPSSNIINVGLSGPGTHLEETSSTSLVAAVPKTSGRGRRKNRKKVSRIEDSRERVRVEPVEEFDASLSEDIPMPTNEGQDEQLYSTHLNVNPELVHPNDNQLLLNTNILDQILSYKKMCILQSPEVVEFLSKQQSKQQSNSKKKSQH
ncbi:Lysosomal alpha-mannosidase [Armadillidium vulgare]|nr:Lysosomal alpha-mannosidase [Armadillidium vulgare]